MAKGSNGEHFLLLVLNYRRECLASKRFNTRVRDDPIMDVMQKSWCLNPTQVWVITSGRISTSLPSILALQSVKLSSVTSWQTSSTWYIHKELVFLKHSKTKGKHFIKLIGNRWKTCRAPSLAIPKLAFSLRNCSPALLFWIEKLNQDLKFFVNIFTTD